MTFTGLCPFFGANCFQEAASGLVVYVPDDQLDAYKTALPEGLETIDWFGAMLYTCTPTEIGLDMDYSGMILHLEPAQ